MSLERGRCYGILGAFTLRERKLRGWTQTELAQRLGVSQPTIARIEAGKLPVEVTLARLLARVLFERSWATVERRIRGLASVYEDAQLAVNPQRIASRDAERALISYVVAVAA